jgi:beta-glucanase (GH16 family)
MKDLARLVASALAVMVAAPVAASSTEAPTGYKLVWADEFNRSGRPDPAKWGFEQGFVRNAEMQWYQPDNAFIERGLLVIEGRRERKPNPRFGDPAAQPEFRNRRFVNFTAASLTTKGLHSWQYGRFEIRARIKTEQGLWPALWFVGSNGKWPASGEIDLMEYYEHSILGNFAWASASPGKPVWKGAKIPMAKITSDPDWDQRFHTWVMDWDERQISLFLDDRLINRIDLDKVRNKDGSGIENPFRQPHHLIINLALGGQRGGPLADTKLPTRFEIDYVRIYQKVPQ